MSHLTMIKNKFQSLCKMMPCWMACTNVSEQCAACTFSTVPVSTMFHKTCIFTNTAVRTCTVTSCLPSTILISLTPFSIKVLAAARPAMPAPTIITWQKFVWSGTGTLVIGQLQQFRYKCNVRHLLSYRHRAQETVYTVTGNCATLLQESKFLKSLLSTEIQLAVCNSVHVTY